MSTSPVVWLLVAKYNSLWCSSLKAYLVCAKNLPPCQKMARSNPPMEMFQLMVQTLPLKKFWRGKFGMLMLQLLYSIKCMHYNIQNTSMELILNFLTCVWASEVPKPEWYAFIHHCMQCSYKWTVLSKTDAGALGILSFNVPKVKSQFSLRYFFTAPENLKDIVINKIYVLLNWHQKDCLILFQLKFDRIHIRGKEVLM